MKDLFDTSIDEEEHSEVTSSSNGKIGVNRRRMAWVALNAIIVVTLCAMFLVTPERLDKLDDVITWFYMCMCSIVLGYLGFTTYAFIKKPI